MFNSLFLLIMLPAWNTHLSPVFLSDHQERYWCDPTCPFPSSTSHQCSLSTCSPWQMSVYHCRMCISFPIGLSGFLVYALVALTDVPEDISFLSYIPPSHSSSIPVIIASVMMFPAVSSLSCFTSIVVTQLPVSAPLSSNPCPATVSLMYSTICIRPSPSFTETATSLHSLHVNTISSPLVSVHFFPHPNLSYWAQLPQRTVQMAKKIISDSIHFLHDKYELFPYGRLYELSDAAELFSETS